MRRRPSRSFGRLSVLLVTLGLLAPAVAAGQRGIALEGAIFLLLPLSAEQATGGQSVADPRPSTGQLFWNPAGAARLGSREAAFHHASYFVGPLNAAAVVLPFDKAGVLGLGVGIL